MKLLRNIFKNPNLWPVIIVLFFALIAGRSLLTSGYFNMHDDLQMMRQLEMEKCFKDGQIPCRWVPDMGDGYGFPLFNFYPPLPYLVGQVIRTVGFSFVDTAKIVFLLSFLVSGVTMYFLSKEFFGKLGGVVSSIFYVWAPYHSVDIYVRGAMNEAWALAWFPLILLAGYKVITTNVKFLKKWVIVLALSWAALLLSHNLMVLIFTPVFAGWCLIFLWKQKGWSRILPMAISGISAIGFSAFFTLPAVFEQKYVHVDTLVQGYYEYIAHFATISQLLFSRFWGYGASVWGENDGMPFSIGHAHWLLSIVLVILVAWEFKKHKKISVNNLIICFMFLVGWATLFMIHSKSTFLWQLVPPLKFVQFPWRFLALATLSFSLIAGGVVEHLKLLGKLRIIIPVVLVFLVIGLGWSYFLPLHGKMGPLTDEQKFTGAAWDLQRTAGIFDYLPKTAKENPKEGQSKLTEVIEGKSVVTSENEGTNWAKFNVNVSSDSTLIRIGIFEFPNWRVFVDGQEIKAEVPESEKWGRMYVTVPKGEHQINFKLYNTPLRIVSNLISVVFWVGLLALALRPKFML